MYSTVRKTIVKGPFQQLGENDRYADAAGQRYTYLFLSQFSATEQRSARPRRLARSIHVIYIAAFTGI
eukprot:1127859-Pleurochrysis_carterae.AAC.1